jgi:Transcriptional regulator, AbiEi antitoxin/Protein of unknown function (DUF559)
MAGKTSDSRSARAWELARRQHGVLSRRDLLALGFSSSAIEHRLRASRLHRVGQGVYAVGRPELTREGRWMAAVLACAPDSALSHRSAASLWRIRSDDERPIHVSVRRRCEHRRSGIRTHSRPSLRRDEVAVFHGIPVTVPARTLLDLATELRPRALERAVNEADKRDLIDPVALRGTLEEYAGEPGVRALRGLLDRDTFLLSDSDLELLFRPIVAAAGLPLPETKKMVNGYEVDFFWSELGLVIETDGLRYHRTPSTQARDRVRDHAHVAAGLTPLRFTHRQIKYEEAYVRDVLRKTAERLWAELDK